MLTYFTGAMTSGPAFNALRYGESMAICKQAVWPRQVPNVSAASRLVNTVP